MSAAMSAEVAMADETVEPLAGVTHTYSYDYQSSNVAPTSGQAHQSVATPSVLKLSETDHNAVDQSANLVATVVPGSTITINGVVFNVLSASASGGVMTISVAPPFAVPPFGVTNITFFKPDQSTAVGQPLKPPIIPPPPITIPASIPQFPPIAPNTTPVAVPVGPLVGPAVAPAAVPPSTAGFPLVRYQPPGSATAPPPSGLFPQFTTTPPSPPVAVHQAAGVFGIFNGAVAAAGQDPPWTWPMPPSTPTTAPITLDGFVAQVPPWQLAAMNGEEQERAGAVHRGHARPAERRRRTVLSKSDDRPQH